MKSIRRTARVAGALALALAVGPLVAPSATHAATAGAMPAAPAQDHIAAPTPIRDASLGVAVTPAPGVRRAGAGKYPPGQLALEIPARPGQPDNTLRLVIAPDGVARQSDPTRAAATGLDELVRAARVARPVARRRVMYGGAPGMLAYGLPGGPSPTTAIVLAHDGHLYKILAPGTHLAPDQVAMLSSLRFIPRTGAFPPSS